MFCKIGIKALHYGYIAKMDQESEGSQKHFGVTEVCS